MRGVSVADTMTNQDHVDIAFNLFRNLRSRWTERSATKSGDFFDSIRDSIAFVRDLRKDPQMATVSASLYPELKLDEPTPAANEAAAAAEARAAKICKQASDLASAAEIIQIMEEGWVSSGLDEQGNRTVSTGWMNMMRRWSQSKLFRDYWLLLRSEFAREFVRFCEDELNADRGLTELRGMRTQVNGDDLLLRLFERSFKVEWPTLGPEWPRRTPEWNLGQRCLVSEALTSGHCTGWTIHLTKPAFPDADPQLPIGFLLFRSVPLAGHDVPPAGQLKEFEILPWVAPPFRHLGIGTAVLREFFFVNTKCRDFLNTNGVADGRSAILQVRYQNGNLRGEFGHERLDAWQSFCQYFGFREQRDRNPPNQVPDLILYRETRARS